MPLDLTQHLLPLTPCDITRYKRTFLGDYSVARRMCCFDVTKTECVDLSASLFGRAEEKNRCLKFKENLVLYYVIIKVALFRLRFSHVLQTLIKQK